MNDSISSDQASGERKSIFGSFINSVFVETVAKEKEQLTKAAAKSNASTNSANNDNANSSVPSAAGAVESGGYNFALDALYGTESSKNIFEIDEDEAEEIMHSAKYTPAKNFVGIDGSSQTSTITSVGLSSPSPAVTPVLTTPLAIMTSNTTAAQDDDEEFFTYNELMGITESPVAERIVLTPVRKMPPGSRKVC